MEGSKDPNTVKDSRVSKHKNRVLQIPLRCHYCKTNSRDVEYVLCGHYPQCKLAFCLECARLASFKELGEDLRIDEKWLCQACKGECRCIRCQSGTLGPKKRMVPVSHSEDGKYLRVKQWRGTSYLATEVELHGPKEYAPVSDNIPDGRNYPDFEKKKKKKKKKKIEVKT
eukprot:TRINITY_DN67419_c0_g1_i2.p2 TRINITY_DN67419_c0_g1~~TRINITY_DN67419_c0_g1_i2.p2  ORF type:complete len:170 (+),score=19.12 TRINITY_DN67419_c0_g1_i2:182-691(+)